MMMLFASYVIIRIDEKEAAKDYMLFQKDFWKRL
jgi:hypothetical protein